MHFSSDVDLSLQKEFTNNNGKEIKWCQYRSSIYIEKRKFSNIKTLFFSLDAKILFFFSNFVKYFLLHPAACLGHIPVFKSQRKPFQLKFGKFNRAASWFIHNSLICLFFSSKFRLNHTFLHKKY